jgi:para-nitrobenzyl esterase
MLPLLAAIEQPVKVEGGLVAGVAGQDKSILVFKGIPFAAPPVGDDRWREPQPVAAWTGVKRAEQFSASCAQTLFPGRAGIGPWTYEFLTHNEVSEDCLYLNVWTPAKSAHGKLPVFVYIYGGGFTSGSGAVPIYDGEGLARKGLVVVTFNYRVGVFGFLAHPELTKESPHHASGNYGLLDQIAALRWVHKNIAAFGGDPARVTIAGQSAGAISVHYLLASPLARGLYQRAIAQSGGSSVETGAGVPAIAPNNLTAAEADGVKFASQKGVSSLRELRAMTWQELLKPVPWGQPGVPRFSPIVDGYVAPLSPLDALLRGKLNDVTVLTGCTTSEIAYGLMGPGPRVSADIYQHQAARKYGAAADEFLKLYPAGSDDEANTSRTAASTDESLVGMYLWARKRDAAARTRTFIYLWDHPMPGSQAARWGAFHSSEIAYAMDTLYGSDRPFTDADRKIADMMSSYWTNFAASGDPNGKGLPRWLAVGEQREVMELGDHTGTVPLAGDAARIAFFERYLSHE